MWTLSFAMQSRITSKREGFVAMKIKLIFYFSYYSVTSIAFLLAQTLTYTGYDAYYHALVSYLQCESLMSTKRQNLICDRSDIDRAVFPYVIVIAFFFIILIPIAHLIYSASWSDTKSKLTHLLLHVKNTISRLKNSSKYLCACWKLTSTLKVIYITYIHNYVLYNISSPVIFAQD